MNKIKYFLIFSAFALCFCSLFLCWDCLSKGVTKGMYLCVNIVIPSLFPVLSLCAVFIKTGICERIAKRCDKLSGYIFRQSGYAVPLFCLSAVSGYPVGAVMAQSLYKRRCVDEAGRDRLTLCCCGAGPAFIVLAVGVGMLNSYQKGIVLLIAHVMSSAFTAVFVSRFFKTPSKSVYITDKPNSFSDALCDGVACATSSMINISAFTILFSAIISILSSGLRGTPVYIPLTSLFEVSNAAYILSGENSSLPLISAVLGFGGLSVICQIASITKCPKIRIMRLVCVRLLHAVNSYFFTTLLLMLYKIEQPAVKTVATTPVPTNKNIYFSVMLILLCTVFIASLKKAQPKNPVEIFKM